MTGPNPILGQAGESAQPEHFDYSEAIYGSLLATSLVALQWRGTPSPDLIAFSLVVTLGVYWLAHVWAEVVNLRVHNRFSWDAAAAQARFEATMLLSAIVPAVVLAIGPRLGLEINTAVGVALIVCLVQLFVWGLVVGRAAHRGWLLPLIVAVVDTLLGVLIVALKVAVLH